MDKTSKISLRVRPEVREAIERLAQADRRSMSAYIELVLERHAATTKTKPTPR